MARYKEYKGTGTTIPFVPIPGTFTKKVTLVDTKTGRKATGEVHEWDKGGWRKAREKAYNKLNK